MMPSHLKLPRTEKNDPEYNNLMLALYHESIQFCHDARKVMKQIGLLKTSNKKSNSEEDDLLSVNIDE